MAVMSVAVIHDWSRVEADTWHAFHYRWISDIERALNGGVLPDGYYANPEQHASGYVPDVLALEEVSHEIADDGDDEPLTSSVGGVATLAPPASKPHLRLSARASDESALYAARRRTVAVRHRSGDRLVALLELASPGNKDRASAVDAFVAKAVDALHSGVHVSVIDLLLPRADAGVPGGLCGRVARAAGFGAFDPHEGWSDKPLMVAAFEATRPANAYAEPLAVGDALVDLPLFYKPGRFVDVPLARTYAAAWDATPRRWREVIAA